MFIFKFRESPLKPVANSKLDAWAYKNKIVESVHSFLQDHFSDIKHKKEITLALNICKEIDAKQKIGAKIVRRSLENSNGPNSFKFDNQVLKGFAITWYKQTVVHYVDFNKTGMYCVIYIMMVIFSFFFVLKTTILFKIIFYRFIWC